LEFERIIRFFTGYHFIIDACNQKSLFLFKLP